VAAGRAATGAGAGRPRAAGPAAPSTHPRSWPTPAGTDRSAATPSPMGTRAG
jgi:hypothetical protein